MIKQIKWLNLVNFELNLQYLEADNEQLNEIIRELKTQIEVLG